MMTTDRPKRTRRGPAAAVFAAATLLLISGQAALGMDSTTTEIDSPDLATVPEPASLSQLREQLDTLVAENGTLLEDNSSLSITVEEMTRERDRLQASLTHFDDMFDPIEADRQLLVELRKGLPETRGEAEAQLDRLERLALSSNPARLGQLVDRITDTAPAFFDWRFTEFGSTQEASQAYVNSGANAFDSSMEDFRNAVLLSVANRLDGLLTVLDRVR